MMITRFLLPRLLCTLCALTFALGGCGKQEPKQPEEPDVLTLIPDPVFLAYCRHAMDNDQRLYFYQANEWYHSPWDKDGDGKLSIAEAADVQAIDLFTYTVGMEERVASMEGIEYFTGLQLFDCSVNKLTELDMSGYTSLCEFYCSDNRLEKLDVSDCTSLTKLYCPGNILTSLDMSGCMELDYLSCSQNQLSSLDVSDCRENDYLGCAQNLLTSIDVSECTELSNINCGSNRLTLLDVSKCTKLSKLFCSYNPGDGVSKFPVRVWFDNNSIPAGFDPGTTEWDYDGTTITTDFQQVN
jgi:hypothetical protein